MRRKCRHDRAGVGAAFDRLPSSNFSRQDFSSSCGFDLQVRHEQNETEPRRNGKACDDCSPHSREATKRRGRGIVGVAFQLRSQSKDRQSIERPAAQLVQPMQNAQPNRRARAQTARRRNFRRARERKWERLPRNFVEEPPGCSRHNPRHPRLSATPKGYMIVNAKRHTQAVKTRAEIGSARRHANGHLLHHWNPGAVAAEPHAVRRKRNAPNDCSKPRHSRS